MKKLILFLAFFVGCFSFIQADTGRAANLPIRSTSITDGNSKAIRSTALGDLLTIGYPLLLSVNASNCVAATAISTQFTLPTTPSKVFRICGGGGLSSYAFISCGTNPTATTTAASGFVLPPLADGQCLPAMEIQAAKCAVIGGSSVGGASAAGGAVCFLQLVNPTGLPVGS
jgi:hypothetical protein